jgi:hypothetical protein
VSCHYLAKIVRVYLSSYRLVSRSETCVGFSFFFFLIVLCVSHYKREHRTRFLWLVVFFSSLFNITMSSTLVKVERPDLVDSVMKPSNDTRTVMKYIGPRTIGINHTNNFQGSLRNFALANLRSTANVTLTTATASHGLASLIPNQTFTSLSPNIVN